MPVVANLGQEMPQKNFQAPQGPEKHEPVEVIVSNDTFSQSISVQPEANSRLLAITGANKNVSPDELKYQR